MFRVIPNAIADCFNKEGFFAVECEILDFKGATPNIIRYSGADLNTWLFYNLIKLLSERYNSGKSLHNIFGNMTLRALGLENDKRHLTSGKGDLTASDLEGVPTEIGCAINKIKATQETPQIIDLTRQRSKQQGTHDNAITKIQQLGSEIHKIKVDKDEIEKHINEMNNKKERKKLSTQLRSAIKAETDQATRAMLENKLALLNLSPFQKQEYLTNLRENKQELEKAIQQKTRQQEMLSRLVDESAQKLNEIDTSYKATIQEIQSMRHVLGGSCTYLQKVMLKQKPRESMELELLIKKSIYRRTEKKSAIKVPDKM